MKNEIHSHSIYYVTLYKTSLSSVITHIKTTNRMVCDINIKVNNILLIILLYEM